MADSYLAAQWTSLWRDWLRPARGGAGNDYRFLRPRVGALRGSWQRLRASVVVPVYDRRVCLARTLAALCHQSYPRELFEVIVADDGSHDHPEEVVAEFSSRLNLRIRRQEDLGFRAAAARNLGLESSTADVILTLDADMIPAPDHLTAHLRWFHVTGLPLAVIGYRKFVDAEALSPEEILADPASLEALPMVPGPAGAGSKWSRWLDWRVPQIFRTRWLRTHPLPWALTATGTLSFRRAQSAAIGGFSEDFRHWGGEDTEFGYRLWRHGAYFIPEPRAVAYHQDHPAAAPREEDRLKTMQILRRKVPPYRKEAGVDFEIPRVSIFIPTRAAGPSLRAAIDSALAQQLPDLEVCLGLTGAAAQGITALQERYAAHPRLRWTVTPGDDLAGATRAAIALCQGQQLMLLGPDQRLGTDAAESLADALDTDANLSLVTANDAVAHIRDFDRLCMFPARDYHRAYSQASAPAQADGPRIADQLRRQGRVRRLRRRLSIQQ